VAVSLREAIEAWYDGLAAEGAGELAGGGSAGHWLRQAALESLIAQRMAAWAVVSIHRALLAGATLPQAADAAGITCAQAAERWRSWADGQRQLRRQVPGLGLGEDDYLRAASVIEADAAAAHREMPAGCGHAGGQRK
jgi:hypothetical protein